MAEIGKRIKARREEVGLTQEELAIRLGYKSKSTINKIEMGINDINQTKIVAFANALNTTPAHLMGWDDPKVGPVPDVNSGRFVARISLDKSFMESVKKYWDLNRDHKKSVSDLIDYLSDKEKG